MFALWQAGKKYFTFLFRQWKKAFHCLLGSETRRPALLFELAAKNTKLRGEVSKYEGEKNKYEVIGEIQLTGFQLILLSQSSFFYSFFSVFRVVKSGEEPPLEFSPEMKKQIKRSKISFIFLLFAREDVQVYRALRSMTGWLSSFLPLFLLKVSL